MSTSISSVAQKIIFFAVWLTEKYWMLFSKGNIHREDLAVYRTDGTADWQSDKVKYRVASLPKSMYLNIEWL